MLSSWKPNYRYVNFGVSYSGFRCRVHVHFNSDLISIASHASRQLGDVDVQSPPRGREKQGEKTGCFFFFFSPPCVDLNDLTAITPKQKLEDRGCGCERARLTDAALSGEDILQPTACHFHVVEDEVRVNVLPRATERCFFI